MKRIIISLICSLFFTGWLAAQNTISAWVADEEGTPIPYANVILLHPNDSIMPIRGTLTNETGHFQFEKVPTQKYRILVYMIGYNKIYTDIFQMDVTTQLELPSIKLTEGVLLKGVEVKGKKPPYQQEMDGLRINVENSAVSAGGTALEVLERSPGISVDRQNGNISLAGKEGVNVMINGKLTYVPADNLVQFLEGISADNISSIKLMTTPPSKYDAEGAGGYIDIQLKRNIAEGLNGSYALSVGYGRGHRSNNNLNFNYRKDKLNLYGSYSYLLQKQAQLFNTQRQLQTETREERSQTIGDRDPRQQNHNGRLGLDYEVNSRTIIGALFSSYDNQWKMEGLSTNRIYINDQLSSLLLSNRDEINHKKNYSTNLNLKHYLAENESISFDIDYLNFYNNNPTTYSNRFFDDEELFIQEQMIRSGKQTPLNIWVGKMDYEKQWNDKIRLELGAKSVLSTFENDISVEDLIDKIWQPDPSLTSNSDLKEKIWAAYISSDVKLSPKTNAKLGLRYEYTDSQLNTDAEGLVVDRQFGAFFPTVLLSHQFDEQFRSNFSYSRRITRPTFNEIAPFVYFLDPNTFFSGNSGLQPAITDAVKLDLNYKNIFFSAQYAIQDSAIVRFQQQYDPASNRLIFVSENLKNAKTWSFTLGMPFEITPWWNMRVNATYYCLENNGYLNQELTSIQQHYAQVNTNQSFQLPLNFSAELAFVYTGPSLWGKNRIGANYDMTVGLQKQLGENGGTIRFNVSDALNSNIIRVSSHNPKQNFFFDGDFDLSQRTFSISYTRNFGNHKVKASRKRVVGAAEELQRAN